MLELLQYVLGSPIRYFAVVIPTMLAWCMMWACITDWRPFGTYHIYRNREEK